MPPPRRARRVRRVADPLTSPLRRTVDGALGQLDAARIRGVALDAADRARIETALRAAVARHLERCGPHDAGVAPVRIACSYLLAGDQEAARGALHHARDLLR